MKQKLETSKKRTLKISGLLFTLFFVINLSVNGGHLDNYDGTSAFLMTENFVENGNPFNISNKLPSLDELKFPIEQHVTTQVVMRANSEYSKFSEQEKNEISFQEFKIKKIQSIDRENSPNGNYIVLPIVAIPFYYLAEVFSIEPYYFVPLVLNSMILAFASVFVFSIGSKLFGSEKIGFVLALIFGLCSFIWPYQTTMLARPIGLLFVLIATYSIISQKDHRYILPIIAGIGIGLSVLSNIAFVIYAPALLAFGIFQFRNKKTNIIIFLISFLVIIGILALVNYERFGDVSEFGIGSVGLSSTKNSIEGVIGYIISPGRSLFLYLPIAVIFPISLYLLFRKNMPFALLVTYMVFVTIGWKIFYESWDITEWGSHRYHIAAIPFIIFPIGCIISEQIRSKLIVIGIIILSSIGFIVNLFANLVGYENVFRYAIQVENIGQAQYGGGGYTWNAFHSPIIQPFKIISSGWLSTIESPPKIGLSNCAFDLYFYCNHGIFSILIFTIIIGFLSYIILKILLKTKISD